MPGRIEYGDTWTGRLVSAAVDDWSVCSGGNSGTFSADGEYPRYPFSDWFLFQRYCYRCAGISGCYGISAVTDCFFRIVSGNGAGDRGFTPDQRGASWNTGNTGGIFPLYRTGCGRQREADGQCAAGMVESL